ncbi:MAG: hypothetical protein IKM53_02355 [Clostridia bacterium]|nr:hypothetical protein [Clostridia bacterium]
MLYTTENKVSSAEKAVVLDGMIMTTDSPTEAGSKMLGGYVSLFEAEAVTRLKGAGFEIGGKADVGEFAFDLLGESSANGANLEDGTLVYAASEAVKKGDAAAALSLDVNGAPRRGAAQTGLVNIKPTYGTVSRYGTVPVACSGETVSVTAATADKAFEVLCAIVGHDDKDGTSLPEADCEKLKAGEGKAVKKVALAKGMTEKADGEVKAKIDRFCQCLEKAGVEVCEIDDGILMASRVAWNILMSAELCNNVSRYDGVKYGYRAQNFNGIDELYTNSRTEAFGELLKTAILFGSETLSTENYMKVYDKALRIRRVICEEFGKLFKDFDAVLMPACSKMSYGVAEIEENKFLAFEENLYTAPASVTGLPAVTADGVQIVGAAFSEKALLDLVKLYEKEGK